MRDLCQLHSCLEAESAGTFLMRTASVHLNWLLSSCRPSLLLMHALPALGADLILLLQLARECLRQLLQASRDLPARCQRPWLFPVLVLEASEKLLKALLHRAGGATLSTPRCTTWPKDTIW